MNLIESKGIRVPTLLSLPEVAFERSRKEERNGRRGVETEPWNGSRGRRQERNGSGGRTGTAAGAGSRTGSGCSPFGVTLLQQCWHQGSLVSTHQQLLSPRGFSACAPKGGMRSPSPTQVHIWYF